MKLKITLLFAYLTAFLPTVSLAQVQNNSIATEVPTDTLEYTEEALQLLPYLERVQISLNRLLESPLFETSQVGFMAYDLDADSTIFAYGERQLLRPASTMKLLTAITALDHLGTRHRFRTEVLYSGKRDSTSLHGNIYLYGTMDPTLDQYDIDYLVEGIASLKVDTIRGNIVTDNSFKDENLLGEGWCWDDKNPLLAPLTFRRQGIVAELVRHKLTEMGIVVMGYNELGECPDSLTLIAERLTSIEPVLSKMMKDSDNQYAEAVYYQLGAAISLPSTAKKAQILERQTMQRAGLNPDNYRLADGSGLSLYNYLSAESLVSLLRYAHKEKRIFGALCQSLPVAGIDGTLKRRMNKESLKGNVMAKTGTLTGIYSLAGYLTSAEGHLIAFAIINQGVMSGARARNFQDSVCEVLSK